MGISTIPIIQLRQVAHRFERSRSLAERIAGMGRGMKRPAILHALRAINLDLRYGEILGLVGETGSGKSTLGRIVAGTLSPSEGEILFRGEPTQGIRGRAKRRTARRIQMVFQNPMASLNPRVRIADAISEAPIYHGLWSRIGVSAKVDELMGRVGLNTVYKDRLPHQLSGGERQRVSIARALAVAPDILVCDEAVSALDVSVQAQILNLFAKLRQDLQLTYLFISHDLGVVRYLADRVAVMYLGQIVEIAPTEDLFASPKHPYTRALVEGVLRVGEPRRTFRPIRGETPSPFSPPPGCHFHPRCPVSFGRCTIESPSLQAVEEGRFVSCHLAEGSSHNARSH